MFTIDSNLNKCCFLFQVLKNSVSDATVDNIFGEDFLSRFLLTLLNPVVLSLLFWRSSTHFIGGLGVVVFLLLILPNTSPMKLRLSNIELSSLSKSGYRARSNQTSSIFAYVYLGLMVLAFIAFLIAGMSPFDAICHAFSVCATGGFSTKNQSIGGFNSLGVEIVTIVFLFLASIPPDSFTEIPGPSHECRKGSP